MSMSAFPALATVLLLTIWPSRPWQWWLAMTLAVLTTVLMLLYVVADHFTGEGITLAVFAHVLYGWRDGELDVARFPWVVVGVMACLLLLAVWCWVCWCLMRARRGRQNRLLRWLALPAAMVVILSSPAMQDLWLLQQETGNAGEALHAELQWDVGGANPKARPFVWIYLESLERAFLDQERLPGVAPRLAELEREHLSFRGIRTAPLMNWTVAGMVASQCGMPFEPLAKQVDGYQAGASCLGDWLVEQGYTLSYVGGADPAFSGKGRFYRSHGFSTVLGFDDLKNDAPEHSIWGAYDDVVFARAQMEFMRLQQAGSLFGLVVLTTATHPPDGYISPSCPKRDHFDNPMLAAAHCSDGQVAKLVTWFKRYGPEDLLIFISSDHLQVAGSAQELLQQAVRENTLIVIGRGQGVVERPSTMVDVAPTVAGLLGFEARAMGLGRNLRIWDEPTLVEKYGYASFMSMLPGWRVGLRKGDAYELCDRRQQAALQSSSLSSGPESVNHITQVLCKASY